MEVGELLQFALLSVSALSVSAGWWCQFPHQSPGRAITFSAGCGALLASSPRQPGDFGAATAWVSLPPVDSGHSASLPCVEE